MISRLALRRATLEFHGRPMTEDKIANQDELEQWTANYEVWYVSTLACRTAQELKEVVTELASSEDDFDVDLDLIDWDLLLEYVHV